MRMDCLYIIQTLLACLCATASSLRMNEQEVNSPSVGGLTQDGDYFLYHQSTYPKDCKEAQRQCSITNSSGVYVIKPYGISDPFEVFCNHEGDAKGGWTVIQRRENGVVDFNRSWTQYKEGFGFLSTDFWLGNEKISYLTNQASYELRVDFQLSSGGKLYTIYKGFRIADEFGKYNLFYLGPVEGSPAISSCPTNMKYGTCACQTTCEDPNGESGCHGTCSGVEGCVCPVGFHLNGTDCIHRSGCGCFIREANLTVPDGGTYVNDGCTRRCSCRNNQLTCGGISCDNNAACMTSNQVRQCVCNEGYEGDGHNCEALYTDCKDVYDAGNTQDGMYTILPSGWADGPFSVYCKMDNGGGWTVFQKRGDGTTSFYKNWNEYKQGFGDLANFNGDFWLGNDKLHFLTNQRSYKLRFDVTSSDGSRRYGEYSEFEIESENTNYKMNRLGSHSGTTGNYLYQSRSKQFSTAGRDNDQCGNFDCAEKHRSGWWHWDHDCSYCYGSYCYFFHKSGSCHTMCTDDNPNGDYGGGNGQNIFTYYRYYSYLCNLRSIEMKIKPSS